MKEIIKLLQAITFMIMLIFTGFAAVAPFSGYWWTFVFSFVWAIFIMTLGRKAANWASKFFEE